MRDFFPLSFTATSNLSEKELGMQLNPHHRECELYSPSEGIITITSGIFSRPIVKISNHNCQSEETEFLSGSDINTSARNFF